MHAVPFIGALLCSCRSASPTGLGAAIEADLGAISPGRAAAGGGHGRLAEGERAFCTIMYHILTQPACSQYVSLCTLRDTVLYMYNI